VTKVAAVRVVKKATPTTVQAKTKARTPEVPVAGSSNDPPKAKRSRNAKKAESSSSESEEDEEEEDDTEDVKGKHARAPFKGCKQIMQNGFAWEYIMPEDLTELEQFTSG
jgi:hypothetical protein